jgi:hypothetical protein
VFPWWFFKFSKNSFKGLSIHYLVPFLLLSPNNNIYCKMSTSKLILHEVPIVSFVLHLRLHNIKIYCPNPFDLVFHPIPWMVLLFLLAFTFEWWSKFRTFVLSTNNPLPPPSKLAINGTKLHLWFNHVHLLVL